MSDEKDEGEKPRRHSGQFKPGFDARRSLSGRNKPADERGSVPKAARAVSHEMLQICIGIARDPEQRARDRIMAAEKVLDRGLGSSKKVMEVTGQVNHLHAALTVDTSKLTMEHAIALLDAIVPDDSPESAHPMLADWSEVPADE